MIYLKIGNGTLIILEPGNIERLKEGRLAVTPDRSISIAYAPDHVWLQEQIFKIGANKLTPADLTRLLEEGLSRPEVINRPFHPTWDAATTKEGKA
jgi:hypothetical protein